MHQPLRLTGWVLRHLEHLSRGTGIGLVLASTRLTSKVSDILTFNTLRLKQGTMTGEFSVSWSGTLDVPSRIKGIRIRWEYAPQVA